MTALDGRIDYDVIAGWVSPGARVLDLGCGDGALLRHLQESRGATGYGVEIDIDRVIAGLKNGINVLQIDLEKGLYDFVDQSFDLVIISNALQTLHRTEKLLTEMLRVGREAIVTFPNFGFWQNRWSIALGRMPVTRSIPFEWYNTPNIHWCTLVDFEALCAKHNIRILERAVTDGGHEVSLWPNLLGSLAFYRLTRN